MKLPKISYLFVLMHVVGIVGAFYFPPTRFLISLAIITYIFKHFFLNGGYHRYFAHRSFKLNRFWQFWFAFFGGTNGQKSALWWASGHRYHHKYSDQPEDMHSPLHRPLLCHGGWVLMRQHVGVKKEYIKDFLIYPELVWLDKYFWFPVLAWCVFMYLLFGFSGVIWGGIISSLMSWHATFTNNSLSHLWGNQEFESGDNSRNNALIAILTLGEGWHNNHHAYPASANNGFYWWQVDITYYIIKILSFVGIVSEIHVAPTEDIPKKEKK